MNVMVPADLIPALGHARVLSEGLVDHRRRVAAFEGEDLVGIAAFEPLFGPHAEGVIAIRRGDSEALVPYLLDELLECVHQAGLVAVRFVFPTRAQHDTAKRLSSLRSHCSVRRDWLDIRIEPVPEQTTVPVAA